MRWSNSSSFSAARARSPLLLEREPLLLGPVGLCERLLAGRPRQERPRDEPDGGDGEQGAEDEGAGEHYEVLEATQAAVPHGEASLLARVRPQRDDRAEQEDEPGEPDQVHERVDERLEVDRAVRVHLLGDQEQVLRRSASRSGSRPRSRPAARPGSRSCPGAMTCRAGRRRGRRRSSRGSRSRSARAACGARGRRACSSRDASSTGPGASLVLRDVSVGARAGDPDREQDDRGVDDVAAVAAPVARR